jgi:hypothetical protein
MVMSNKWDKPRITTEVCGDSITVFVDGKEVQYISKQALRDNPLFIELILSRIANELMSNDKRDTIS